MSKHNTFGSREDLSNLLEGMRLGKISPDGPDDPDSLDNLDRVIADLIAQQDEDGFLGFVDPRRVSSEIRVDLYYVPTYLCAAILMKCWLDYPVAASRISGFTEVFRKALSASTKRSFKGHGFDDIYGVLNALEIFHKGGAARFISSDTVICPEFNETVTKWLASFKKALETGNTLAGWDQDYSEKYRKILSLYDSLSDDDGGDDNNGGDGDSTVIFIYGSLMKGRANHRAYLGNPQSGSRYLGEGVLSGYALYDLGAFPGIRPSAEDRVKGELYEVSRSVLADINRLESEGTLYLLKKAKVAYADNSAVIHAYTYVYNNTPRESDRIPFGYQPWGKYGNYVWYASYGSNMLYERFMCYILGKKFRLNGRDIDNCNDTSPPISSMPVEIPYNMYFGNSSKSWGGSGVSFLDTSKPGKSLGRMYLITNEQMDHVHCQESKHPDWYDMTIDLGSKHGIPIKTITNHGLRPKHPPNEKYTSVIFEGLRETYPEKTLTELREYIDACK